MDSIFENCIRTGLHFDEFVSMPHWMKRFYPCDAFESMIRRCDTVAAVERLSRLISMHGIKYPHYTFHQNTFIGHLKNLLLMSKPTGSSL